MLAAGDKGVLSNSALEPDELESLQLLARLSSGEDDAYGDEAVPFDPIGKGEAKNLGDITLLAISQVPPERVESGANAGAQDGTADLATWKAAGLERDSTIYVTWAVIPDPVKYAVVGDYLASYGEALDGYYGVGLRAGTPALKEFEGQVVSTWRTGGLGANNDGGLDDPQTPGQFRAMVANLLYTSPASIADFDPPINSDDGVKLVYVLRGDEVLAEAPLTPEPASVPAPEPKEAETSSQEPAGDVTAEPEKKAPAKRAPRKAAAG